MARYHGPQQRGAARQQREKRRFEAEVRNALTKPERRANFGRGDSKRKAAR